MRRTLNAVIVAATGICLAPLAQSATISMTADLVLGDDRAFQPGDSIIGSSASGGTVAYQTPNGRAQIDMYGGFTPDGLATFEESNNVFGSHRWRSSFTFSDSITNTSNQLQPATFGFNVGGGTWRMMGPAGTLNDVRLSVSFNGTVVAADHGLWSDPAGYSDPQFGNYTATCVDNDQDVGVLAGAIGCWFQGLFISARSYEIQTSLAPGQTLNVVYEYVAETLLPLEGGVNCLESNPPWWVEEFGGGCGTRSGFGDPMILRVALDEPVGGNLPEPGTLALVAGGFALAVRTRMHKARSGST